MRGRLLKLLLSRGILMPLLVIAAFGTCAKAQTSSVVYSVNPSLFPVSQASSTFLCVSANSVSPLTLGPGDRFTFSFGASIGSVTSVTTPVSVNSSTLLPTDFSASVTGNAVVITYVGTPKSFPFGNSVCVKANFTSSAQVGSGDISFSSRFTQTVNGNAPFTTVSIVNFATGPSGTVGPQGPTGPQGPPGTPSPVTFSTNHDVGQGSGGLGENDSILSISASNRQFGGFTPGFPAANQDLPDGSAETYIPTACTLSHFSVRIDYPQTVSGTTLTFTLRTGTSVAFDPANPNIVTNDMTSTAAVCTIAGSATSCTSSGLPLTIPAGSLVDIFLHVSPLNTLTPSSENAIITLVCR